MTTFTREQIKRLRNDFECWQQDYDPTADREQYKMFGDGMAAMDMLLAAMQQEPVAYIGERMLEELTDGARSCGRVWPDATDELSGENRIPLYVTPPAPVVPDNGRQQFEEWFKFHHGDEHSIITLSRANGGANYRDPHVDLAWIAWKDSRAAMQSGNSPVIPNWHVEAERMAELHGASFVIFRHGEKPVCADPSKFWFGYDPAAPQQEVKS